jgi:hypothetical protein
MSKAQKLKIYIYQNWQQFVAYASFSSVIFGVKLWVISCFGNATPYWDQWDSEAANLYKPFLDGTYVWTNLFAFHNEHRILTTRLLALALLKINGIWDPLLQMVVNAGLHIAALVLSITLLTRVIGRNRLPSLLVFSLVLFCIPYGWENTLAGFQSQFYLVLLFGIACQWFTITQQPFSVRWWSGVVCGVLAYFSLAGGIFVFASAAIVGFVFFVFGLRKTLKQFLAVALLGGLFIFGAWQTPSLPYHASLKAHSFHQFIRALTQILAWPMAGHSYLAFLRNSPVLVFIGYMIWKKPPANDRRWFLFGLIFWGVGQAVSIAYGRAEGCLSSRYLDIFAITVLVNFACLIFIGQGQVCKRRPWVIIGMLIWISTVLMFLGVSVGKTLSTELTAKRDTGFAQELNTRNYLATGDFVHLKDKPYLHVPYPDSQRLASILASPTICSILPTNISRPLTCTSIESKPVDAIVADGYYPTTPKRTGKIWGSFGTQGNLTTGQAWIRFEANKHSRLLAIPVAGYPLNSGMNIEVEQNGHRKPLVIKENPKESWSIIYARVGKGPFSIHITDFSTTFWEAVGAPSVAGNLEPLTNRLLAHWSFFVMLGLMGGVVLMTVSGLKSLGTEFMED